jgi:uncharacterized protein (DUF1684 family)
MTVQDIDRTTFEQDWAQWHRQHEAVRAGEHGFLAITSLNWLTGEPQRFPDAPGTWRSDGTRVTVELGEDEALVIDGTRVTGQYTLDPIPERGGVSAVAGDAVIEVARRGGYDIVRPRHPGNQVRVSYTGTPAYGPDPQWAIPARFVTFAEPRPTTVGAVAEGIQHIYDALGYVEFERDGQRLRLTAFNGHAPGSLSILFTDATSGVTTYPANRSLQVAAPGPDGAVTIDFNRAVNLPCAYTQFATCPLPPTENRLPIPVEAGEKLPHEHAA